MRHLAMYLSLLALLCMAELSHAVPVATVQSLTQQAWATSHGQRLELEIGQGLMAQDSIHTNSTGALSMRFSDGTELNMRSSTSVDIADYVFDDTSSFTLDIISGAATIISGAIVQQNPEAFKIITPLGTIGVRGTTIFVSVSTDKVSIVITDMSPGHSVLIIGLDGQQVMVTEPGMQIDLIRGEPTPPSASPLSYEARRAIENPDDNTYTELPHRDTGEQSMLVMTQDMNAFDLNSAPIITRMTYPAFLLGLDNPAGFLGLGGSMSNDGRYVAATNGINAYLWDMQTGNTTLLPPAPASSGAAIPVSADGSRVLITRGLALSDNFVYDIASATSIGFSSPIADNASPMGRVNGISGNGNVIVGEYQSTMIANLAVARWDYNGTSYQQTPVLAATTSNPMVGQARAVNVNGSVIAGSTIGTLFPLTNIPAYWVRQGNSNIYDRYLPIPATASIAGELRSLSNNGQWGTGYTIDTSSSMTAIRVDTTSNNVVHINPPAGASSIFGNAISNDGRMVGGEVYFSANSDAFFWTQNHGIQIVDNYLRSNGINPGGTSLSTVNDISGDGSILLCFDKTTNSLYLVRIDGDYLGITTPSNIYASLAEVAAGSSSSIANTLPIASLSNTSGFSLGTIPSAGEVDTSGGSVLRVWASGTLSTDYGLSGDDKGAIGAVGASYFMNNGFSFGGGVFYSYRSVDSLWGSNQENKSISLGLYGGYAPERTGVRLSMGLMGQSYDLDTRRNYPNGTDLDTSIGKGRGWGLGLTGHAGWVFAITDDITIQPFAEYTFQRIATPDYSEQGGAFPVDYNRHYFNQNITRLGADLQWDILPVLNLQLWLAWNHRFEDEGPASSGQIIGWDSFYFPGARLKQDWGDTGVGLRWRVYDNTTLGLRLGFGIDNKDSGLADMMGSFSVSVDI